VSLLAQADKPKAATARAIIITLFMVVPHNALELLIEWSSPLKKAKLTISVYTMPGGLNIRYFAYLSFFSKPLPYFRHALPVIANG
jgi:hypothetical protein